MKMVSRTARKMGSRSRKMVSRARKMMGGDDDDDDEEIHEGNVVAGLQTMNKTDGLNTPTGNNQYATGASGRQYRSKERSRGVFYWAPL